VEIFLTRPTARVLALLELLQGGGTRRVADLAERLGVTESRVSQMRTDALKLMRAGIEAQYAESGPTSDAAARGAHRTATYAAALAARSTYAARLSQLPSQRRPVDERVAG
jgi:RNA polymerase sigma factor for flagellar operon FliA